MPIRVLVVTTMNHYPDEDISDYVNEVLENNNINSDNLVDIKFSASDHNLDMIIIYKINKEA